MRNYAYLLFLILILAGCGSSTPGDTVGTGSSFSSLSTQPDGLQLYNAINAQVASIISGSNIFNFDNPSDESWPCVDGQGTIDLSFSSNVYRQDFTECKISMSLGAAIYTESVSGLTTISFMTVSSGLEYVIDTNLTVSGDLGFSMVCDTTTVDPDDDTDGGEVVTGQCVFQDSEGTQITVSGQAIEDAN